MFQGLRNKPKKTAHVKPDLIDVDLVRGEYWVNNLAIQVDIEQEEKLRIGSVCRSLDEDKHPRKKRIGHLETIRSLSSH